MADYDKTLVTKGPWEVFESGLSKPKVVDQRGLIIADVSNFPKASIAEIAANAAFIAEAGTVLSETAMTPRELATEITTLRADYEAAFNRGLRAGNELGIKQQEVIHASAAEITALRECLKYPDAFEHYKSALTEWSAEVNTLHAEITTLRAEKDRAYAIGYDSAAGDYAARIAEMEAEIERLRAANIDCVRHYDDALAEVKRLREAAKPLVDRLAVVEQVKNARGVSATTVEMADLRGLRAALAPKENAAMPLVTVPIDKWCECSKRFVAACNCPAQVKPKDTADD